MANKPFIASPPFLSLFLKLRWHCWRRQQAPFWTLKLFSVLTAVGKTPIGTLFRIQNKAACGCQMNSAYWTAFGPGHRLQHNVPLNVRSKVPSSELPLPIGLIDFPRLKKLPMAHAYNILDKLFAYVLS